MEVHFSNTDCTGLKLVLREVCGSEQTQELKLSDGMPDAGRVISAWGQSILRSKEWNYADISCSAGMMVWVLYAPEDGSEPRTLNTWIPFQLRWELPEGTPEGRVCIQCLTRFVDARSVSPRKILIRAGISAQARAYVPEKISVSAAEKGDPRIELLKKRYPVPIRKEAGEKAFQAEETLTLPESAPKLESLVYCQLNAKEQEARVLSDKLVFRGNGRLHVLYRSEEGQLHSWDFSVPFSQFALLDASYGSDAQGELTFCVTSLEPEIDENGAIRLKCSLVCQYVVTDREMLDVVEDAYSPGWELELNREEPTMDVVLDRKKEALYPEQTLQMDGDIAADVRFLPDFPRIRRDETGAVMQWPGTFQVLCYGQDGALRSGTARWEGEQRIPMDADADLVASPDAGDVRAAIGSGSVTVSAELPVEVETSAEQSLPMVTGLRLGQQRKPDSSRPSLILRRAGDASLWEMAKEYGSTMDAIRKANGLQEEPLGNRMLLIPVL